MFFRIKNIIKKFLIPDIKIVKVPVYIPVLKSNLLKDRIALITGGTSGIGLAMVKSFVDAGAKVIFTGHNQQRIDLVLADKNISGQVHGVLLDNADVNSFRKCISNICDSFGLPDILVNNAGVICCSTFGDIDLDNYDQIMDTNLRGCVFLSQLLSNIWKEKKIEGNILNICSSSSNRPGNSPYVLSKWGMKALTIGMAKQLIPYGITVNGLAPGPTATKLFIGDGSNGINWPYSPIKRLGTEQEIAQLAVILVSGLARLVVGDVLFASGGAGITTFDDIPS